MFKKAIQNALARIAASGTPNDEAIREFSEALGNQLELMMVRLHNIENGFVALRRDIKLANDDIRTNRMLAADKAHTLSNYVMGLDEKINETVEYIQMVEEKLEERLPPLNNPYDYSD